MMNQGKNKGMMSTNREEARRHLLSDTLRNCKVKKRSDTPSLHKSLGESNVTVTIVEHMKKQYISFHSQVVGPKLEKPN